MQAEVRFVDLKEGFIICNNEIKEMILKQCNDFKNYIFLNIDDLRKKMNFSVKKRAVYELMKQYKFSYSLAKEYINALQLIEDKFYNDSKLDSIVSVLHFLQEKDCIVKDDLFLLRLKQFPVTFIDPFNSLEYQHLKDKVNQYTKVYEIWLNQELQHPKVLEFQNITAETQFICNQIKILLRQGVSSNQIYIFNADDSYEYLFHRLSKNYGISFNFNSVKNILSNSIIQSFLKEAERTACFSDALMNIPKDNYFYHKIIDILNLYEFTEQNPNDVLPVLTEIFKEEKYPEKKYIEGVHISSSFFNISDTDYAFYVGFNLGSSPKVVKEEGFLTDKLLHVLNCSTSLLKNKNEKENLIHFIQYTKNLCISYKLQNGNDVCLPSLLMKELNLIKETGKNDFGYSKREDDLRLAGLYDEFLKYKNKNDDLEKYKLNGIPYNTYNHQFKGLEKDILHHHFSNKQLKLAYSNMKLYFACPFGYYADRILGLNEFKPQMAARLGTYAHAVLEDSYKSDFNFENSVLMHHKENCQDAKDDFFFSQMASVLRNLIDFNKNHEASSSLKNINTEEHIIIKKELFSFEGYIDKLMYTIEGDDVYAAIVDYKTGADIVSLDNIEDGFHLQLPSYMYLLKHYEPFYNLNLHIIGIYLQKVNIVLFNDKKSVSEQIEKNFKLEGYTVADPKLIMRLDPTYENSTYIKSLGITQKGFRSYSKVFPIEQQEEIIKLVDSLITNAASNILNGKFEIAPKRIKDKNESCTFCKYKDICFMDYTDEVELKYKPFGKEEE